jgi:hypothetical protein
VYCDEDVVSRRFRAAVGGAIESDLVANGDERLTLKGCPGARRGNELESQAGSVLADKLVTHRRYTDNAVAAFGERRMSLVFRGANPAGFVSVPRTVRELVRVLRWRDSPT